MEENFAELTTNPMGQAILAVVHGLHTEYVQAHESVYGATSPKRKEWEAAINATEYDDDVLTNMTVAELTEIAKLSDSPEDVKAIVAILDDLLSSAKSNMTGLFYGTKRSTTEKVGSDEVAVKRDALDTQVSCALALIDGGYLTADALWSVLPSTERKIKNGNGATKRVYGGPSIPQVRVQPVVKANSRANLIVDGVEHNGPLKDQVSQYLRLDMDDFRELIGPRGLFDSSVIHYHTLPDGTSVTFQIRTLND